MMTLMDDFYMHIQTIALAREYYGCDDIQGVYLENEGGSGTARFVYYDNSGALNIFT